MLLLKDLEQQVAISVRRYERLPELIACPFFCNLRIFGADCKVCFAKESLNAQLCASVTGTCTGRTKHAIGTERDRGPVVEEAQTHAVQKACDSVSSVLPWTDRP